MCARGADRAASCGRSALPLESATRFDYAAKSTTLKSQGEDPAFDAAGSAHRRETWEALRASAHLRLRLSPLCLRSRLGRAPRPCCSSQLRISAPAQGTRVPSLIALGALTVARRRFSFALKKPRAHSRLVGASSNQAPERTRGVSFGEATRLSTFWIKCLRLTPKRPRVAQRDR